MKVENTRKLTVEEQAALDTVAAMPDRAIDTSDMPEVADWTGAVRGGLHRPVKRLTSLRLDADLLEWFKRDGAGYQTRINAACGSMWSGITADTDPSPRPGGWRQAGSQQVGPDGLDRHCPRGGRRLVTRARHFCPAAGGGDGGVAATGPRSFTRIALSVSDRPRAPSHRSSRKAAASLAGSGLLAEKGATPKARGFFGTAGSRRRAMPTMTYGAPSAEQPTDCHCLARSASKEAFGGRREASEVHHASRAASTADGIRTDGSRCWSIRCNAASRALPSGTFCFIIATKSSRFRTVQSQLRCLSGLAHSADV